MGLLHQHLLDSKRCSFGEEVSEEHILLECITENPNMLRSFLPEYAKDVIKIIENERTPNRRSIIKILKEKNVDCSRVKYPYSRTCSAY